MKAGERDPYTIIQGLDATCARAALETLFLVTHPERIGPLDPTLLAGQLAYDAVIASNSKALSALLDMGLPVDHHVFIGKVRCGERLALWKFRSLTVPCCSPSKEPLLIICRPFVLNTSQLMHFFTHPHSSSLPLPSHQHSTTLLSHAVMNTVNMDIIELLLQRGADPCKPGPEGISLLHVAAATGDQALAQVLIDHGADVHVVLQGTSITPLLMALSNEQVRYEIDKV